MPGHLIDVALNALGQSDIRALRMSEKEEGFRMLRNFLKGVFVLVDVHGDSMPAPNSRKKKIVDIISFIALERYTFVKDGVRTTVKVRISEKSVPLLNLSSRIISNERTART